MLKEISTMQPTPVVIYKLFIPCDSFIKVLSNISLLNVLDVSLLDSGREEGTLFTELVSSTSNTDLSIGLGVDKLSNCSETQIKICIVSFHSAGRNKNRIYLRM